MKLRYRLFLRRKSVYFAFDDTTKPFTSLKTKDKAEATRLLMAMNEAGKQPAIIISHSHQSFETIQNLDNRNVIRGCGIHFVGQKFGAKKTRMIYATRVVELKFNRCCDDLFNG